MRLPAAHFAFAGCIIALSCATAEEGDSPSLGAGSRPGRGGSDGGFQDGGSGTSSGGTSSGGSTGGGAGGVFGQGGAGGILGGSGTAGTNGASGTAGMNGASGTAGRGGSAGTAGTSGTGGRGGTGGAGGTAGTNGASGTAGTAGSDGGSTCGANEKACGGICVPINADNGCVATDNQCDSCGNPPVNSNATCTSGRCDFTCNAGYRKTATGCESTTGTGGSAGTGGGSCTPSSCTNNCSIASPFRCCRSNGQCGCSWFAIAYCN